MLVYDTVFESMCIQLHPYTVTYLHHYIFTLLHPYILSYPVISIYVKLTHIHVCVYMYIHICVYIIYMYEYICIHTYIGSQRLMHSNGCVHTQLLTSCSNTVDMLSHQCLLSDLLQATV
jgi:hypothetical protein